MVSRLNYFVVGILAAAVISAITVPFLAWFFSADSIGRFSFFLLTVSFVVQIGTLGLEQGYVREYQAAENRTLLFVQALAPSLALAVVVFFLIFGLSLFDELARLVVYDSDVGLGVLIFLSFLFSIFHRFLTVQYRVKSLGGLFCFALVSVKVAFLIAVYFSYLFDFSEKAALYGAYVFSLAFPMLLLGWYFFSSSDRRRNWRGGFFFSGRVVNYDLIRYSFPLLFGAIAFWGVKFSGHIGLRLYGDFESLGHYAVGVSVAAGLGLFGSIFNTMWFPFLFKAESAGCSNKVLQLGLDLTMGLLLLGVGVTGVLSEFVVKLLPPSFMVVGQLLPLLVLSFFLYTLSEVSGSGIALSRKTRFGFYAGAAASLGAILFSLWLSGVYGARGAALSYAIGHLIFFCLRTEFSRRLWPGQNFWKAYCGVLLAVIYCIAFAMKSAVPAELLSFVGLSFCFLALAVVARSALALRHVGNVVRRA